MARSNSLATLPEDHNKHSFYWYSFWEDPPEYVTLLPVCPSGMMSLPKRGGGEVSLGWHLSLS